MIIANMRNTSLSLWLPRLTAFVLGLLLAGSAVYWGLQWPRSATGPALPTVPTAEAQLPVDATAVARLLGGSTTQPDMAAAPELRSRLQLTGIIASPAGHGVALLSLDGKPPKPYRVGSVLEDGLVLQSVRTRSVALGREANGPVRLQLELAPRP